MIEQIISWDTSLFVFLNNIIACPAGDVFFVWITNGRNWIIPGLIIAGVYLWKGKKEAAIGLLLAIITVSLTDPFCARIFKPLFGRLRPCNPEVLVEGARFLLGKKTSLSFPSCHATNMFGQAVLFTLLYPKKFIWFYIFAITISYSRIYVGVHYPVDVLGGAVLGTTIGAGVYLAYINVKKKYQRKSKSKVKV